MCLTFDDLSFDDSVVSTAMNSRELDTDATLSNRACLRICLTLFKIVFYFYFTQNATPLTKDMQNT